MSTSNNNTTRENGTNGTNGASTAELGRQKDSTSSPPIKQMNANSWMFKPEELVKATPSRSEGVLYEQELVSRAKGVNFIIQVASSLQLPRMTVFTAAVFLHRFYMRCSIKKYHYYDIGGACLFLATKVEESTRRAREVAIACTKVASKNPKMIVTEDTPELWKWRDRILFDEEVVLEMLCFDMSLESPYQELEKLASKLSILDMSEVLSLAKGFIDDSTKTPIALIWPTKRLVAGALHYALEKQGVELPLGASVGSSAPKVSATMSDLYGKLKHVDPTRAKQYSNTSEEPVTKKQKLID